MIRAGRDGREHQLEHREQHERDRDGVDRRGRLADAVEHREVQVADQAHAVEVGPERQREADDDPDDAHERQPEEAVHDRGQDVLAAHEAAVEQGEAGQHDHDQRGRGQHPGGVAGVDRAAIGRRGDPGQCREEQRGRCRAPEHQTSDPHRSIAPSTHNCPVALRVASRVLAHAHGVSRRPRFEAGPIRNSSGCGPVSPNTAPDKSRRYADFAAMPIRRDHRHEARNVARRIGASFGQEVRTARLGAGLSQRRGRRRGRDLAHALGPDRARAGAEPQPRPGVARRLRSSASGCRFGPTRTAIRSATPARRQSSSGSDARLPPAPDGRPRCPCRSPVTDEHGTLAW